MKRRLLLIGLISVSILAAFKQPSTAGPCRRRVVVVNSRASVHAPGSLTVVPFAVPVAVPVATISRPTLFYGYSNYAPSAASKQPDSGAADREFSSTANDQPANSGAVEILKQNCAACHTGAASQGGLQLFHDTGQIFDKLPRHVILEMVSPDGEGQQAMPPGDRRKLSAEEVELIREWAKLPRNAVY